MAFAAHVGGAGGLNSLIAVKDGALAYRISGGSAALPGCLAEALAPNVRLGTPVARIERRPHDATVYAMDGTVYRSGRVVIALDPSTASTIEHHPPLPLGRLGGPGAGHFNAVSLCVGKPTESSSDHMLSRSED